MSEPIPTEIFRPKNGDELMEGMSQGKTAEVPSGYGMKSLAYLESRVSNWSVLHRDDSPKGWIWLQPTGNTARTFRRYLDEKAGA